MCFLDLLSFRVIKKFFPDFFSHLRDRVLKQLVKNLVFTFEFFSREKCAVLRVVGLCWYTINRMPKLINKPRM